MRKCGRCHESKPLGDFAWRRKKQGQRNNYCRPCRAANKQEHYRAHRRRYIEQAQRRKKEVVAERLKFLIDYLREHPCVDCGETDPVVLEFDHLRDKCFGVGQGFRDRSWQSVLDEIAKCEVVCANCHRRRTARRGGFARAAVAQW
jgi:5-methylcytosine-specific restriction endonuclease McrA